MQNSGLLMRALATALVSGSLVATASLALASPDDSTKSQKMVHISESGDVRIGGKVSAVSSSKISLTSWLGVWAIDASDAKFNFDSLSDVKVGDKVVASGKLTGSGMSIMADVIHDLSHRGNEDKDDDTKEKKSHLKGQIEDFSKSEGTFILETKRLGEVKVETSSDTKVLLRGHKAGVLGDLANGMKVMVHGMLDIGEKTMTAFSIKAKN